MRTCEGVFVCVHGCVCVCEKERERERLKSHIRERDEKANLKKILREVELS